MLWGVFALKCSVFQKIDFSKFSIDWTCCLTDCKCDKNFGQKHRNWKFFNYDRSRIDRTSIESGRLKPKILIAISIDRKTGSFNQSKVWKNQIFEKRSTLMQKLLKAHCFKKKGMSMRWKVFQKHLNLIQIFQNQDFQ